MCDLSHAANQSGVDAADHEFWNTNCGSHREYEIHRRLRRVAMVTLTQENMHENDDPQWEHSKVLGTRGNRMGLGLHIQAQS